MRWVQVLRTKAAAYIWQARYRKNPSVAGSRTMADVQCRQARGAETQQYNPQAYMQAQPSREAGRRHPELQAGSRQMRQTHPKAAEFQAVEVAGRQQAPVPTAGGNERYRKPRLRQAAGEAAEIQ